MEGFERVKNRPSGRENLLNTHLEKIRRGQEEVFNRFKAEGMFNKEGELSGEIVIERTTNRSTFEYPRS